MAPLRVDVRPKGPARSTVAATICGMDVPAVWTISPGADRQEVEDLLARLAERLGIPAPEPKDDMVLLPANYPAVARALDEVEPGWDDEELLVPPVA